MIDAATLQATLTQLLAPKPPNVSVFSRLASSGIGGDSKSASASHASSLKKKGKGKKSKDGSHAPGVARKAKTNKK